MKALRKLTRLIPVAALLVATPWAALSQDRSPLPSPL